MSVKELRMNKTTVSATITMEKPMHAILLSRIPGIRAELAHIGDKQCSYKVSAFFAIYTKKQIRTGNLDELKKCFAVADALIRLGTHEYKHAIENVYLFSLALDLDKEATIKSLLPSHLKKIYEKQLKTSGF